MRASKTRILIVGEQESASEYETFLRSNRFDNISKCEDPTTALQEMEYEPQHVVIADVRMSDMDVFEFAANIREIERSGKHFTYILIVADDNVGYEIDYSRQANVDAVVLRRMVRSRLIPQVMSGERMSLATNSLLENNRFLQDRCEMLEPGQLLDPLTGLGNRRRAMSGMEDMIKEIEARGGAIVLLLISLDDIEDLQATHGQEVVDEMIVSVGHKIRRLTRPLDIVAYIDTGLFAIVMHHNEIDHCTPDSYARIKTRMEERSYQVQTGFLQPQISIGACGASAETGPPKVDSLMAVALTNLTNISSSDEIHVSILNRL